MKAFLRTILLSMGLVSTLALTSCGQKDGDSKLSIPGVDGPYVQLLEDSLQISMTIQAFSLDAGVRYPIPKLSESYVEIGPALQSTGTLFVLNIHLRDVLGQFADILEPTKLPGGRNLPGVRSGSLPAVAFSIPAFKNTVIYISTNVFGFFVPVKFNIGTDRIISASYYLSNQKGGMLSVIGQDTNGENSGVLLLLDMNSTVRQYLQSVVRRYNRS